VTKVLLEAGNLQNRQEKSSTKGKDKATEEQEEGKISLVLEGQHTLPPDTKTRGTN
jgi:hypothetical protein